MFGQIKTNVRWTSQYTNVIPMLGRCKIWKYTPPPRLYPGRLWAPQNLPRGRSWSIPRGRLRWLRIYHSLPGSTPPLYYDYVKCIRLPESTPPSQNNPPLFNNYMRPSQNIPLSPRIYPPPFQQLYATLSESTLPSQNLFNNYNIMRPSQNLPLSPKIPPPLFNNSMRRSQNLPLLPRL